jgi:hypothetical protein
LNEGLKRAGAISIRAFFFARNSARAAYELTGFSPAESESIYGTLFPARVCRTAAARYGNIGALAKR